MRDPYTSLGSEMMKVVLRMLPDDPNCTRYRYSGGDANPTGEREDMIATPTEFSAIKSSAQSVQDIKAAGQLDEGDVKIRYLVGDADNYLPDALIAGDSVFAFGEWYEVYETGLLEWNGVPGPWWARLKEVQNDGGH